MGEEKDKKEIADHKKPTVEVFVRDSIQLFIYKKTEKISAAVCLLSEAIPTDELFKNVLKNKCVDLVGGAVSFCFAPPKKDEDSHKRLLTSLLELDSLFRVAAAGGIVSEMNSEVLSREIAGLGEILGLKNVSSKNTSASIVLPEDFFFAGSLPEKDDGSRGFYKGQESIKDKNGNVLYNPIKDKNPKNRKIRAFGRKRDTARNEERRLIIKELLKKQQFVTVKDVVKTIKDCGEKTLQRELIAMVKDNVLRREGDRRWSRYFLK